MLNQRWKLLVFSDPQKPFEFYSIDGFRLRMYNETPYDASHRL